MVAELTAGIGGEVRPFQLNELPKAGRDELALFVAQHKLVACRGQGSAGLSIQKAHDFAEYYGASHIHQASGASKGFPEVQSRPPQRKWHNSQRLLLRAHQQHNIAHRRLS